MPNWSNVKMKIESVNSERIEWLFNQIKTKGYEIDEEFVCPNSENWYDWNNEHYGSKWDMLKPDENGCQDEIYVDYLIKDGNTILINFRSPWCGPYKWFNRVCEKYNLSGTNSEIESGMDFFHKIVIENGIIVEEIDSNFFGVESIEEFGLEYFEDYIVGWIEDCDEEDTKQYLLSNPLIPQSYKDELKQLHFDAA